VLSEPFMQHAFLAGTFVALACGLTGYLLVMRSQMFAGDALSHVALTGALGAAAFGVDIRMGLFFATALLAAAMGALGRNARTDDVVIGTIFAWVLGLGVLFLSIFATSTSGASNSGTAAVRVLFGSIFGLSAGDAWVATIIAIGICVLVVALMRPLLFASIDPVVARARGVPTKALGVCFLLLVGVVAAETSQAIGALLLLGLLAGPAGAAHQLSASPYRGLALSALLALISMWAGLAVSYAVGWLPPSSAVIAVATAFYLAAAIAIQVRKRLLQPRRAIDLPSVGSSR
jgi:zinc/manganese transport system permease protein